MSDVPEKVRLTLAQTAFLERFVKRGWLHRHRDSADEQAAVDYGLKRGWLRRELSEAHFTPAGRAALHQEQDDA